jgi:hypothetical protein
LEDLEMAINVSPGVYVKIVDLSEYVRQVPSTIGFIPIFSEKGPDNQLVFTNGSDYFKDFGEPNVIWGGGNNKWTFGQYCASNFLSQSDALYVVRMMPEDSAFANIMLTCVDGTGADDIVISSVENLNYESEIDAELADTVNKNIAVFYGIGRGEYYNKIRVSIEKPTNAFMQEDKFYYVNIYLQQKTVKVTSPANSPTFDYGLVESFVVSFDYNKLDANGESAWVEDVINKNSRYIKCKANKENCEYALVTAGSDISRAFVSFENITTVNVSDETITEEVEVFNGIDLENGSDGAIKDVNGVLVDAECKALVGKLFKGTLEKNTDDDEYLTEVLDNESIYFSLVFCPYGDKYSYAQLLNFCQVRGDCIGVVDNGDNKNVAASITNRSSGVTSGLNAKEVAIYDTYSKVFDGFTAKYMWISPVYHMAKVFPYNDNVADIWNAPAGPNRAAIAEIEELRYNPGRVSERDQLYLQQINPIVRFSDMGTMVYGQLTSQKRPTALQDINVVRTVLYIRRALVQYCRYYIFESNNSDTWARIDNEIRDFLNMIQTKGGLRRFETEVGATDYEFKAKQCHVNVTLYPTKVIEQINLTFFIKN